MKNIEKLKEMIKASINHCGIDAQMDMSDSFIADFLINHLLEINRIRQEKMKKNFLYDRLDNVA